MDTLGFIGLGVMGEPMCRNLAKKSSHAILGYQRLAPYLRIYLQEG